MEWALLLVIIILLGVLLLGGRKSRGEQLTSSDLDRAVNTLRTEFTNSLNAQKQELSQTMQTVHATISASGETLKNVGVQLGALGETAKQIQEIGKNISSLQEILAPPKLRGELGELLLENLLSQCLPKACYQLQHVYTDGTKVDALIFLAQGRIPVDSKFPLESFRRLLAAKEESEMGKAWQEFERDVQKHVDGVASYIRTDEGTLDFALMYIPAENIYYEMAVRAPACLEYARSKRVFPVSPNTFYAYLQAIALGLRGLQIEERAREIYGQIRGVERILGQFQDEYRLVGKNIRLAGEHYEVSSNLIEKAATTLSFLEEKPSTSLPTSETPNRETDTKDES